MPPTAGASTPCLSPAFGGYYSGAEDLFHLVVRIQVFVFNGQDVLVDTSGLGSSSGRGGGHIGGGGLAEELVDLMNAAVNFVLELEDKKGG